MKTMLTVLAMSLALTASVWADDAHHPDKAPAVSAPAQERTVQKMRENAATMQSQLDALAAAKTPEERQKRLTEHMQTMRENMLLGQQMVAGQGEQMGCQMMGPDAAAASPDAIANRMHQMEKRMDMMQMMMERMAQPGGKAARK